jgi:hypothetical protein
MYHGDSPIYYTYKFRGVLKLRICMHFFTSKDYILHVVSENVFDFKGMHFFLRIWLNLDR